MIRTILAAAIAAGLTAGAHAAVLLDDSFDAENGGATFLNYTAFANFTVAGQVDLVRSGDFGIGCAGGAGACVDLDGSPGFGFLNSASFFAQAGDRVVFTFTASGNQRGGAADALLAAIQTGVGAAGDPVRIGFSGDLPGVEGVAGTDVRGPGADFKAYTLGFTALTDTFFYVQIGTASADSVGPILDDVLVELTPFQVPAPPALALFGLGLAALGLRRR